MAIVVLDTNVILRFLLADHEQLHARADEIIGRVGSGAVQALIGEAVIAECVYVLRSYYEVPKSKLVEDLLGILHLRGVAGPQIPTLIAALHIYREHGISFVDSIAVTTALALGAELVTFDKKLSKIAATLDRESQA